MCSPALVFLAAAVTACLNRIHPITCAAVEVLRHPLVRLAHPLHVSVHYGMGNLAFNAVVAVAQASRALIPGLREFRCPPARETPRAPSCGDRFVRHGLGILHAAYILVIVPVRLLARLRAVLHTDIVLGTRGTAELSYHATQRARSARDIASGIRQGLLRANGLLFSAWHVPRYAQICEGIMAGKILR